MASAAAITLDRLSSTSSTGGSVTTWSSSSSTSEASSSSSSSAAAALMTSGMGSTAASVVSLSSSLPAFSSPASSEAPPSVSASFASATSSEVDSDEPEAPPSSASASSPAETPSDELDGGRHLSLTERARARSGDGERRAATSLAPPPARRETRGSLAMDPVRSPRASSRRGASSSSDGRPSPTGAERTTLKPPKSPGLTRLGEMGRRAYRGSG